VKSDKTLAAAHIARKVQQSDARQLLRIKFR